MGGGLSNRGSPQRQQASRPPTALQLLAQLTQGLACQGVQSSHLTSSMGMQPSHLTSSTGMQSSQFTNGMGLHPSQLTHSIGMQSSMGNLGPALSAAIQVGGKLWGVLSLGQTVYIDEHLGKVQGEGGNSVAKREKAQREAGKRKRRLFELLGLI